MSDQRSRLLFYVQHLLGIGHLKRAAKLAKAALRHLRRRRESAADLNRPTWLMTHPLDHNDACWVFIDIFFAATSGYLTARSIDARTTFGLYQ